MYDEINGKIRLHEQELISRLNSEFELKEKENKSKLNELNHSISALLDLDQFERKIKQRKFAFLRWYNGKIDIENYAKSAKLQINHRPVVFKKENELLSISKLIYSKSPFDLLQDKNGESMVNMDQSCSQKIDKLNGSKNLLSKGYSVSTLNSTKSSSIPKLGMQKKVQHSACESTSPAKGLKKSNLFNCRSDNHVVNDNKASASMLLKIKRESKQSFAIFLFLARLLTKRLVSNLLIRGFQIYET